METPRHPYETKSLASDSRVAENVEEGVLIISEPKFVKHERKIHESTLSIPFIL